MSGELLTVKVELAKLNRSLGQYMLFSKKLPEEVLLKKGTDLGYELRRQLRAISPEKGSIRSERIEALKSGQGVHVRKRIKDRILKKFSKQIESGKTSYKRKGKRLNLHALMVQAELNTREQGRGFLAQSTRYPRLTAQANFARSKYGLLLSKAGLNPSKDVLAFNWDSGRNELQGSAVQGLSRPKGETAIANAMSIVNLDMQKYIRRKLDENARKAGLL